jgi:hypothetical protein
VIQRFPLAWGSDHASEGAVSLRRACARARRPRAPGSLHGGAISSSQPRTMTRPHLIVIYLETPRRTVVVVRNGSNPRGDLYFSSGGPYAAAFLSFELVSMSFNYLLSGDIATQATNTLKNEFGLRSLVYH